MGVGVRDVGKEEAGLTVLGTSTEIMSPTMPSRTRLTCSATVARGDGLGIGARGRKITASEALVMSVEARGDWWLDSAFFIVLLPGADLWPRPTFCTGEALGEGGGVASGSTEEDALPRAWGVLPTLLLNAAGIRVVMVTGGRGVARKLDGFSGGSTKLKSSAGRGVVGLKATPATYPPTDGAAPPNAGGSASTVSSERRRALMSENFENEPDEPESEGIEALLFSLRTSRPQPGRGKLREKPCGSLRQKIRKREEGLLLTLHFLESRHKSVCGEGAGQRCDIGRHDRPVPFVEVGVDEA